MDLADILKPILILKKQITDYHTDIPYLAVITDISHLHRYQIKVQILKNADIFITLILIPILIV